VTPIYQSPENRDVPVARAGEFAPVPMGTLRVWPPVVLAPMAGVTNAPFRALCRRYGAGLYVSEMITARGLVEGNAKTLHLASFAPEEKPRSLQLYGVDPVSLGEAVAWLVGEGHVDHIDMNFGCPANTVNRHDGGATLLKYPHRIREIVRAIRDALPAEVPVSAKLRLGWDCVDSIHENAEMAAEGGAA